MSPAPLFPQESGLMTDDPQGLGPFAIVGQEHRFFFQKVDRYEAIFRDPFRTVTSVSSARTELRALIHRESGILASLEQETQDRRLTMEALVRRLEEELVRMVRDNSGPNGRERAEADVEMVTARVEELTTLLEKDGAGELVDDTQSPGAGPSGEKHD